ncbi:hypothetical protein GCM10027074_76570 [Streptomyces deserti]
MGDLVRRLVALCPQGYEPPHRQVPADRPSRAGIAMPAPRRSALPGYTARWDAEGARDCSGSANQKWARTDAGELRV